uniref:Uncharacterized protein n=1 Tax=Caenorhabditis japonica TaxID=281687 RepID=A0A2Q4SY08_CAEJA
MYLPKAIYNDVSRNRIGAQFQHNACFREKRRSYHFLAAQHNVETVSITLARHQPRISRTLEIMQNQNRLTTVVSSGVVKV